MGVHAEFDLKRDCYYDFISHSWIPCGFSRREWYELQDYKELMRFMNQISVEEEQELDEIPERAWYNLEFLRMREFRRGS